MNPICDLHTHSTFSDGTLTPGELIRLAEELNISAVALCDHNTAAGLPDFLKAAENSPVEAIPGTEFSTEYRGTELHILGLFIEPDRYAPVTALLADLLSRKERSNRQLVENLMAAGIELDYDAIKASTPRGQVNRALIAAEMVRLGYCGSIQEAFSQWLSEKRGLYRPPERLDAFEAIRFIKSIGALAVLAHPFLNLDEAGLREFLRQAVPQGLDAMEVYYPKFTPEQTLLAARIAAEFGLLPSGGSDFHGANKPDIQLGTGRNNLRIGTDILLRLRQRKDDLTPSSVNMPEKAMEKAGIF